MILINKIRIKISKTYKIVFKSVDKKVLSFRCSNNQSTNNNIKKMYKVKILLNIKTKIAIHKQINSI